MISLLNRIIERALFWGIAVVHGMIVVVLFSGVVTRYVFNAPLFWSEEVCLLGLLWLTFLGGAVLVRQNKHVSITIFTDLLSPKIRRGIDLINHPLIIICLIVMVYQSWRLSDRLTDSTTPALRISEFWFGISLFVGFVVMLFYQIQRCIAQFRNKEIFPEEPVCGVEDTSGERCNL